MKTDAIIISELNDQDKAETLFRTVLNDGTDKKAILAVLRDQPSVALARLNYTKSLTAKGASDILDEVLGQIPDAKHARELMAQNLSPERLQELLQARGDLPSVASHLAELEDLLQVILRDVSDDASEASDSSISISKKDVSFEEMSDAEEDEAREEVHDQPASSSRYSFDIHSPLPLLKLYYWAAKVKDRADYQEFLAMPIGGLTVKDFLLMAIWQHAGYPDDLTDVSPDYYETVGLDSSEDERLSTLINESNLTKFSIEEIESARVDLARQRQRIATAPATVEAARSQAKDVANKLNF